jgi:hypothetical protein
VRGRPNKTVPESLRSLSVTEWAMAIKTVRGLWHLEGKQVGVFADGFVVASPHNPSYPEYTVENGAITLDKAFGVIHVGLPYISTLETLDIDAVGGMDTPDRGKLVSSVIAHVENTRGLWAGTKYPDDDEVNPVQGFYELKSRSSESYDSPPALKTEKVEIGTEANWETNGRVILRQIDPTPVQVLAIYPKGFLPGGR